MNGKKDGLLAWTEKKILDSVAESDSIVMNAEIGNNYDVQI